MDNLRTAISRLAAEGVAISRLSRLFETAPAYVEDQPRFLNAAAVIETDLAPRELLRCLKRAEVGTCDVCVMMVVVVVVGGAHLCL